MTTIQEKSGAIDAAPAWQTQSIKRARANWWTRRVERPTYEVVGPLERFDERDNVGNRANLRPGTPEYRSYYAAHPEREAIDRRFRFYPTHEAQEAKRGKVYHRYPFGLALTYASSVASNLAPLVDTPPNHERLHVEPAIAARNIKGVARYLGADLVGISQLNPAWVYSHQGRAGHWGEPVALNHKYAISLAIAHDFDLLLACRGFSLACTIETEQLAFTELSVLAVRLASYIRALGYPAHAHTGGGQVLNVPAAVDAGLGEISRPGYLLTKKYGPAVRLVTVTTDMPLAPDKPVDLGVQDFCSKCKKCADVCPVGAVSRGDKVVIRGARLWPFSADKCFRLRCALGNTPCMYCMSACPWTKPRNIVHQTAAEIAIRVPPTRRPLLWIDDILYGRKPRLHAYPSWLDPDHRPGLRERISTFLHKV
ncbi:MAG: 4Fe-4S dicluster domain-containing protein [Chloroflexi bacterium]|nr:4Fe-4S dicluster domain-containing protein [Chloroflexota bacterium]